MLEKIIEEIKQWEGSKGKPHRKEKIRELRKKLDRLIADDINLKEVGDWILVRGFNPVLNNSHWMIYSKEGYIKRQQYVKENL